MGGRLLLAATWMLAAAVTGVGCRRAPPPQAVGPVYLAPEFGSNALERVERLLALGPRDAGTPGAEKAAQWIAAELRASGLAPQVERFVDRTPDGPRPFHNVLAELPGTETGYFLLMSHYDTKIGMAPGFTGANDGGSSTGLLLELAALMTQTAPVRGPGFLFAFLDGEECRHAYGPDDGLHGSRRLARQLRERHTPVKAVILLDMVGDADLTLTVPRNGTPELKLLLLDAAAAQDCRDKVRVLDHAILDDHQPFLAAGFPAINLIDFEYGRRPGANDYWHTAEDTFDKLSAESLRQVGALTLEMVSRLRRDR